MELVRTRLTADDITPPNIRYDATEDTMQVTPDGGATWADATGLDPRHTDAFRSPALSGGSAKCDAAANMVAMVTGYVAIVVSATNAVALAGGILSFLGFIPLVGWLFGLIVSVATALIGIGSTAVANAFSQEVYDQLLCIFFENIGEDGQVSAPQLAAINDSIYTDIGGVAFTVCSYLISITGEVGLSNAGATGDEVGDCGTCAEWCHVFDWSIDEQSWFVRTDAPPGLSVGVYSANAWRSSDFMYGDPISSPGRGMDIAFDFGATVTITYLSLDADIVAGSPNFSKTFRLMTTEDAYEPNLAMNSLNRWSGSQAGRYLNLDVQNSYMTATGSTEARSLTVCGAGTDPFA